VDYLTEYQASLTDPESFWSRWADKLVWNTRWTKVYNPQGPLAKWFEGGRTNIAFNSARSESSALVWYSETGERLELKGRDLRLGIVGAACKLKELGVGKGTRRPSTDPTPSKPSYICLDPPG